MPDRENSPKITVSVIIPVRNGMVEIGSCLRALEGQSVPRETYELIVVDDGSTDGTPGAADREGVILLTQEPRGPAVARNYGARVAQGEILLFTDADCEPAHDWIEQMSEPFTDPEVMGVKGAYWSRQRSLTARFVQHEYETKYRRMARYESIDFVDTYSAGFRKEIFWFVGGFDESYPVACVEDQELSFRLAETGAKMVFQAKARVFHQHAATPLSYMRKKYKIAYWKAKLLQRHPGKAVHDTHTPQTLKLEMAVVNLSVLGLVIAVVTAWPWAFYGPFWFFLGLSMPSALRNFQRDPTVGMATPIYLYLRSLALTLGLLTGSIAHRARGHR